MDTRISTGSAEHVRARSQAVDAVEHFVNDAILRATMRSIADGESYAVPPTIDDPAILQEMEGTLRPGPSRP